MPEHLFNPAKNRIQKGHHTPERPFQHTQRRQEFPNCKKRLLGSTASKTTIHVIRQTDGQRLRRASYIKKIDEFQAKRPSQRNSAQNSEIYMASGDEQV